MIEASSKKLTLDTLQASLESSAAITRALAKLDLPKPGGYYGGFADGAAYALALLAMTRADLA